MLRFDIKFVATTLLKSLFVNEPCAVDQSHGYSESESSTVAAADSVSALDVDEIRKAHEAYDQFDFFRADSRALESDVSRYV